MRNFYKRYTTGWERLFFIAGNLFAGGLGFRAGLNITGKAWGAFVGLFAGLILTHVLEMLWHWVADGFKSKS